MARRKRSELGEVLLRAGVQLIGGSPGGLIVEMLRTIAKVPLQKSTHEEKKQDSL